LLPLPKLSSRMLRLQAGAQSAGINTGCEDIRYSMLECKLCLQSKPLRGSHIIPEFFYRPAYDEKGRLVAIRSDDRPATLVQKGLRERLLCDECEQLLNDRYEKPVKTFWCDHAPVPDHLDAKAYQLRDVPYAAFKLLHLSILWRFAVASDPAFEQVTLGPHQERMRRMIFENDAGRPDEYQIFGVLLRFPDTRQPCIGTFMPPVARRLDGRRVMLAVYGACAWHVVVAKHPLREPLSDGVLNPEGRMFMPVKNITDFAPVANFYSAYFTRARRTRWRDPFTRRGA
jgi:hypothetical protein